MGYHQQKDNAPLYRFILWGSSFSRTHYTLCGAPKRKNGKDEAGWPPSFDPLVSRISF
jgi:hypothetical protein